jgi:hypothetical protein
MDAVVVGEKDAHGGLAEIVCGLLARGFDSRDL